MKQLSKYFPLMITVAVLALVLLSYQRHELRNLLSINDLNKKLRVLQSTSRKSLVDNELAEQLVEEKKYVSKTKKIQKCFYYLRAGGGYYYYCHPYFHHHQLF